MNHSGGPDLQRCARSVSVSRPTPVAPAHVASRASDGAGCAGFSALLTTGRDTLRRLASDPWDSNPASSRDCFRRPASCSLGVGTVRTFRYRRSGVIGNAETYSQLYAPSLTLRVTSRCRPRPAGEEGGGGATSSSKHAPHPRGRTWEGKTAPEPRRLGRTAPHRACAILPARRARSPPAGIGPTVR